MPYPGIYEFTAEAGEAGPDVLRSLFLTRSTTTAVDAILAAMAAPSSPMAMAQMRVLGGAMARVPADATAFAHRDATVMFALITPFEDPRPSCRSTRPGPSRFHEALRPKSTGVYSNFLEAEGEERIREAYPSATYERLADVKRRYDPANLFRMNQNIRPSAASSASCAGPGRCKAPDLPPGCRPGSPPGGAASMPPTERPLPLRTPVCPMAACASSGPATATRGDDRMVMEGLRARGRPSIGPADPAPTEDELERFGSADQIGQCAARRPRAADPPPPPTSSSSAGAPGTGRWPGS